MGYVSVEVENCKVQVCINSLTALRGRAGKRPSAMSGNPKDKMNATPSIERHDQTVPPRTEPNILIAIPCFGGAIQWKCVLTLIDLDRRMNASGIRHTFSFMA